jgi:hypothetical protein
MPEFQQTTPADKVVLHAFPPVDEMSDREIAEETLTHLRNVGQFLGQFGGLTPTQVIKLMLTGK